MVVLPSMVSVAVVIMISSSGVANTIVSVVVREMMAPLQKDVVWLVLSRSVTVLVVVTWPLLFALAPGRSFHFAPPHDGATCFETQPTLAP